MLLCEQKKEEHWTKISGSYDRAIKYFISSPRMDKKTKKKRGGPTGSGNCREDRNLEKREMHVSSNAGLKSNKGS